MTKQKSDLYRDAFIDANSMKDTAVELAKQQLLEAFAPKIQSIVSSKLAEELEDEEEYSDDEMEGGEESMAPGDDVAPEFSADEEPEMTGGEEDGELGKDEYVDNQDLQDIINSLDTKTKSEEEAMATDDDLEKPEMAETKTTPLSQQGNKSEMYEDVDSLIEALLAEDGDEIVDESAHNDEDDEDNELAEQLEEANETIASLQKEIKEVNLLNSKLLFTNKLFKAHELSEGKKVDVIKVFDKAETVKEAKLIFESLNSTLNRKPQKRVVKEGAASAATKSTKTENKAPLQEGNSMKERFMKLANIKPLKG